MLDMHVQWLLNQAVDSPIKLYLLLMFYEHSGLEMTPAQIAERLRRDIWSVEAALQELAADGILEVAQVVGSEPAYSYNPRRDYLKAIHSLVREYNDPLERNEVHQSVRDLELYSSFRRDRTFDAVA